MFKDRAIVSHLAAEIFPHRLILEVKGQLKYLGSAAGQGHDLCFLHSLTSPHEKKNEFFFHQSNNFIPNFPLKMSQYLFFAAITQWEFCTVANANIFLEQIAFDNIYRNVAKQST